MVPTTEALGPGDIRSILIGVLLAMFLASLEQTIVAPSLALIARDLGGTENMPWIATSYLLMATAATPLYGKASDIYGRRFMMRIALGVFVVGAIACALAPTMLALVLARGFQGIGGGGLVSLAQIIIADVIAPKERGRYQSWIAGTFTTSALIGPVLGGFLSEYLHWSAIFWINVPLGLLTLQMINRGLKRLPRHDRPHRLDLIGAVLIVAATILMMLLIGGGRDRGAPEQIGLMAGSLTLWVLFAFRLRHAEEPLVPLRVLANPIICFVTVSSALGYGTVVALIIYVPLYLQRVMHMSATSSGGALTPLVIGTVVGTIIAGQITPRVVHYKRPPLAGLVLATLTMATIAALGTRLTLSTFIALMSFSSIALGMLFPVAIAMIQNAAERQDLGIATATLSFSRQLGAAVLVAIFGAIVIGGAAEVNAVDMFQWAFALAAATFALSFVALWIAKEAPLRGA